MAAPVYPYPVPQPTGEELMSGPITSGVVTRKQKEVQYVVKDINKRLTALKAEEIFSTYKVKLFTISFLSTLTGIMLLLLGTSSTVLFAAQPFNPACVAIGGLLCIPLIVWTKFMLVPSKAEGYRRKTLRAERMHSKGPKLFDRITDAARKATEPPPRRIKVTAVVRKHDHMVTASTWKSFCEEIEHQTGLPIERQIVKFRDEELKIDLKLKMDEHYGLDTGDRLYIYNRGGFTTANSPIRRQYDELTMPQAIEADDETSGHSWMESAMSAARGSFKDKGKGQGKGRGKDVEQGGGRSSGNYGGSGSGGGSSGAGRTSFQRPGSKQTPRPGSQQQGGASRPSSSQPKKGPNVSFRV